VAAAGVVVLTAACAAGQQAQTADERPTLDGTYGHVGQIKLNGVALQAPTGAAYTAGSDVPLAVYITNNGGGKDVLTNVSSSAFTGGWDVVASTAGSTSTSPSATPQSSAAAAPSSGSPQTISPGGALAVGLRGLDSSGGGSSAQTIVLHGLARGAAPLSSGQSVPITFTFAKAGRVTLTVPVQLGTDSNNQSIPPLESSG
jgi:hypothetical protein